MRNRTRLGTAVLVAGLGVSVLSACGSGGGGGNGDSSSASSDKKGGTLFYTTGTRNVEHWDPQRVYIGRDIANSSRLFTRTLVQYGTGAGPESNELHPDLATDTGTASDGNKTWTFTLKDNVKWQDGSVVSCDDVKYGISRTFAVDVITGGPNYAIQFLDIPTASDGSSAYKGPYTKVGQADYDKAVTCDGQKLTFKLKKSVPDFNFATTLPAFAPYKASQDKAAQSNFAVFSDGPYMLDGTWTEGKGGTFVRNPNYDPSTDDTSIRKALPDKITFLEGLATETVFDRLLADSGDDQYLVTDRVAPPAYLARVAQQKDRFTSPASPFVDYLLPNFKTVTNPLVRQAIAVATDRSGYITAEGGEAVAKPAYGLVLPDIGEAGGYKQFKAYDVPDTGDPDKAKALLQQAGVKIPYPLRLTYSGGTPTSDKQAAALKAAYDKAGFNVTLNGLADTYYSVIQSPENAQTYDLTWAGWGADWPNASTVIPPLFDSRVNLSAQSNGQDYGYYDSDETNAKIDEAYATSDDAARAKIWGDLDESLAKEVAYIPLDNPAFPRLHGSKVTNYVESASTNGYPDLGQLGAA
ncbi:ABC transporter substrate-binding protein [Jatrophihabitans sp. YIM 134969]